MQDQSFPEGHKSGFVAVIGRPNVGKSTLINRYLRQSVAPVSPRPQTTRRRQLGILTLPDAQIIFVDTPGIHKPQHKLGEYMNAAAGQALRDAEALLVLFDLTRLPGGDDRRVAEAVRSLKPMPPCLVALNKIDAVQPEQARAHSDAYEGLIPEGEALPISALRGDNCDALLERLIERLPLGPRYYPEDEVTDLYERDIAADLIRAAALHKLRDEVPHSLAVRIDEYKERDAKGAYIRATLFVERESQKGIVIGKQASMLRQTGISARQQIEEMSGRKVFLDLRVKVQPRWRNDEGALRRFGYRLPKS